MNLESVPTSRSDFVYFAGHGLLRLGRLPDLGFGIEWYAFGAGRGGATGRDRKGSEFWVCGGFAWCCWWLRRGYMYR